LTYTTLTYELDVDKIKMNHHAEYLGQRKVILFYSYHMNTDTHTDSGPIALAGPLKWFGN